MARLSKSTREQMAKALVRHRFDARANELTAESAALFNTVLDERYDGETQRLMGKLLKKHPKAFDMRGHVNIRARGMYTDIGDNLIGCYEPTIRWKAAVTARPVLDGTPDLSTDLINKIADHALARKAFGEELEAAYRKAFATLTQLGTAKRLQEEWPEAMPVIGNLVPIEDRSLPVVQLAAINDEFGLPPSEQEAA